MNISKKILLATGGLMLLTSASCDKDDLPKPTQEGKNTMGAIVNGKRWVASPCWGCVGNSSGVLARYTANDLTIAGQEVKGYSNITIRIKLKGISRPGTYTATTTGTENESGISVGYHADGQLDKSYYTTEDHTGTVTITKLDIHNKVVSGTFSLTAANLNDQEDIITVTKGRFDLSLDAY